MPYMRMCVELAGEFKSQDVPIELGIAQIRAEKHMTCLLLMTDLVPQPM